MAILLRPHDLRSLSAGDFSYHADTKRFVAEASTLGWGPENLARIYDDACDVGIILRGRFESVRYYLAEEDRNRDQDVAGWRFKPIPEDVRRLPACAETSVLIIND